MFELKREEFVVSRCPAFCGEKEKSIVAHHSLQNRKVIWSLSWVLLPCSSAGSGDADMAARATGNDAYVSRRCCYRIFTKNGLSGTFLMMDDLRVCVIISELPASQVLAVSQTRRPALSVTTNKRI